MTDHLNIWSKTDHSQSRNSSTTRVGDFNSVLTIMGRVTRQKIIKEREDLTNTINELDVTGIYRTVYPITVAYTFFSSGSQ